MANKAIISFSVKKGTQSEILVASGFNIGELAYSSDTQKIFCWNGISWTYLNGVIVGNFSERPAAAILGRLFYAEDQNLLFTDLGNAWTNGFVEKFYVDNLVSTTSGVIIDWVEDQLVTITGAIIPSSLISNPTMPANDVPSPYVASAKSQYAPADPWMAFDGDPVTYWSNEAEDFPVWIKLDFGSNTPLYGYNFRNSSEYGNESPMSWDLEGSVNDADWDILHSIVNNTNTTNGAWKSTNTYGYSLTPSGSYYRYYRINISESNNVVQATIGEIKYWTVSSGYMISAMFVTPAQLTTASGDIVAQIPNPADYVTTSVLSTISGNIVSQIPSLSGYATQSWTNSNFPDNTEITTVSGDIVDQIPSLAGYATESWVAAGYIDNTEMTSISGNLVSQIPTDYVTELELTTVSGDLIEQIPNLAGYATEAWANGQFIVPGTLVTTSGDIVDQIPSLAGYATEVWVGNQHYVTDSQLTTTSGDMVSQIPSLIGYATQSWANGQFYTQAQISTISGNIVSQIPSLVGYATETWVGDQSYVTSSILNTTSGNIVAQIPSLTNYVTNTTLNTVSGNIVSQIGAMGIDVVGGRLTYQDTTHLRWVPYNNNQIVLHNGTNWELVRLSAAYVERLNTDDDVAGTDLAVDNFYDVFAKYVSATSFTLEFARWSVSSVGSSARYGTYAGGNSYAIGDRVLSGSNYYLCIQGGSGHTPASSPTYWEDLGTAPVNSDFNGLYIKDGVPVLGASTTYCKYRCLGWIYTHNNSATVNFKDDKNYRYIANMYNKQIKEVFTTDTDDDYTYTTAAWRESSNGVTSVRGSFITGTSITPAVKGARQISGQAVGAFGYFAIGLDGVSTMTDPIRSYSGAGWFVSSNVIVDTLTVSPGLHYIVVTECGDGTYANVFYGGAISCGGVIELLQ
jgi:hypothetical protein